MDGAIPTLNGKFLEFVDSFPYLGNNISSTESNVERMKGERIKTILV